MTCLYSRPSEQNPLFEHEIFMLTFTTFSTSLNIFADVSADWQLFLTRGPMNRLLKRVFFLYYTLFLALPSVRSCRILFTSFNNNSIELERKYFRMSPEKMQYSRSLLSNGQKQKHVSLYIEDVEGACFQNWVSVSRFRNHELT